jgi:hypothetical protein
MNKTLEQMIDAGTFLWKGGIECIKNPAGINVSRTVTAMKLAKLPKVELLRMLMELDDKSPLDTMRVLVERLY